MYDAGKQALQLQSTAFLNFAFWQSPNGTPIPLADGKLHRITLALSTDEVTPANVPTIRTRFINIAPGGATQVGQAMTMGSPPDGLLDLVPTATPAEY